MEKKLKNFLQNFPFAWDRLGEVPHLSSSRNQSPKGELETSGPISKTWSGRSLQIMNGEVLFLPLLSLLLLTSILG
jgi:hypothetical protein